MKGNHLSKFIVALSILVVACTEPDTTAIDQALSNTKYSAAIDKAGVHAAIAATETMTAPGGLIVGTVFSGSSTSVAAYSLTDTSLSMTTNRYAGYHLIDVYGTRWPISSNTATAFTLGVPESLTYPTPSTPGPGAYKVTGGAGIYVGQTEPSVMGGICASEIGSTCPIGYVRADHGYFGTGDGNDQDLTVLGCTNIEQLRLLSPYRPSTCNDCGTGSNGCSVGVDCAWNTVTQVNDYGAPDDFSNMVRTSNLHIKPQTGSTDQEWTGINDGNDTGRVLIVQNDSDMSGATATAMRFRHESTASTAAGDRFKFAAALDDWFLEPGATMFGLHDDNVGPDRWRIAGWTSTRWPRIKAKRFDAENVSGSLSSCGTSPTLNTSGAWTFTATPGTGATACTFTFPSGTYTTRPSCIVSFDANTPYTKSVTSSAITVTAVSGTLGKFDVVCGGHES